MKSMALFLSVAALTGASALSAEDLDKALADKNGAIETAEQTFKDELQKLQVLALFSLSFVQYQPMVAHFRLDCN